MNSAQAILTLYYALPPQEQERVKEQLGACKQTPGQSRQAKVQAAMVDINANHK